jgi:hypothetical protein
MSGIDESSVNMRFSPKETDPSRCQVCDKPSTVHLTEVCGKRKRQKHFCDEHAEAAGLPIGTKAQRAAAAEKMAIELRRKQFFIRRHGRLPLPGEDIFDAAPAPPEVQSEEINDPSLRRQFEQLDQMAKYLEANRGMADIPEEGATWVPGMTAGLESVGMNTSTQHRPAGRLRHHREWLIRFGWLLWLISVFVAANLAFRFADAVVIIVGFGRDAYFVHGLHVANWKQGILSNGQPVPGYLELLRITLGFCIWQAWNVLSFLLMRRIQE